MSDRQELKSHVVLDLFWGVNWKAIINFCTPYIIVSSIKLSFASLLQNSLDVLLKLLRSAPQFDGWHDGAAAAMSGTRRAAVNVTSDGRSIFVVGS